MNIYRQLAENVWNPRMSSGADIQRQLDLMDKFQSNAPTSNIGYAMPGGNQMNAPQMDQNFRYGGEPTPQAPMEGIMADDPNAMAVLGYGLFGIPSQAGKAAFPSPTTTVGKGLSKLGSPALNYFTGIPGWAINMGVRQFVNPVISAIEGLLGYGQKGLSFVEAMNMADAMAGGRMSNMAPNMTTDEAMGMLGGMGTQGMGQIGNMGLAEAMGMLGGMGGFGSMDSMGNGESEGEGMGMW